MSAVLFSCYIDELLIHRLITLVSRLLLDFGDQLNLLLKTEECSSAFLFWTAIMVGGTRNKRGAGSAIGELELSKDGKMIVAATRLRADRIPQRRVPYRKC